MDIETLKKRPPHPITVLLITIMVISFGFLVRDIYQSRHAECNVSLSSDQVFKIENAQAIKAPSPDFLLKTGISVVPKEEWIDTLKIMTLVLNTEKANITTCDYEQSKYHIDFVAFGPYNGNFVCIFQAKNKNNMITVKTRVNDISEIISLDAYFIDGVQFYGTFDRVCANDVDPLANCAFEACAGTYKALIDQVHDKVVDQETRMKQLLKE